MLQDHLQKRLKFWKEKEFSAVRRAKHDVQALQKLVNDVENIINNIRSERAEHELNKDSDEDRMIKILAQLTDHDDEGKLSREKISDYLAEKGLEELTKDQIVD